MVISVRRHGLKLVNAGIRFGNRCIVKVINRHEKKYVTVQGMVSSDYRIPYKQFYTIYVLNYMPEFAF